MIDASRRVSLLVGVLIVVVGVTLGGIVIFLGAATQLFSSNVHLTICFRDVTGLRGGAAVLVSGVRVGSVAGIELGGRCGDEAAVDVAIASSAADRLAADSHARLATLGLLGDSVIALVPGHAVARLSRGALLHGEVPPDASVVIAQAGEAFTTLQHIAHRLDDVLADADLKRVIGSIAEAAASLGRVLDRAERGPGLLHLLVYDRALAHQVQALGPAMSQLLAASRNAHDATAQLDKASGDVAQIVAHVKSGQGTIGGLIYDPAIYEDLRSIVGRVRRSIILRALGRFVIRRK